MLLLSSVRTGIGGDYSGDNSLSYKADGGDFLIQGIDMQSNGTHGPQDTSFSFVYVDFNDPLRTPAPRALRRSCLRSRFGHRRVGPPKHVRWIAGPYWPRSHEFNPSLNAAVSGGGRLFYTLDDGVAGITDSPDFRFPARWSLVARDGLSGVLLWKRHIPNWGYRPWNTVGMWSAPLTLPRRLVTNGRAPSPDGQGVTTDLPSKSPRYSVLPVRGGVSEDLRPIGPTERQKMVAELHEFATMGESRPMQLSDRRAFLRTARFTPLLSRQEIRR